MAYDSKMWQCSIYRGQRLAGIRENINDPTKMLLLVQVRGHRRRRIVTVQGNPDERYPKAMRIRLQLRRELVEELILEPHTFDDLFARWERTKPPTRWSRQQHSIYERYIAPVVGSLSLHRIGTSSIDEVAATVKHLKPRTRKAVMQIVTGVLDLAVKDRFISHSPMTERHKVAVNAMEQKRIIVNPVTLYQRVYDTIEDLYRHNPIKRAIFLLGFYGRRKAEALTLRWEDVDMINDAYVIRGERSKVRQDMGFPLPSEIKAALIEIGPKPSGFCFLNERTGRPFTNIQRDIEAIRTACGWPGFMFHSMRNLMVSALYSKGVSAANLSAALGHTRPETLARYLSMQRLEPCRVVNDTAKALVAKGNI